MARAPRPDAQPAQTTPLRLTAVPAGYAFGSRFRGGPTAADRSAMRFDVRHIVWDTTDLRFIVP